MAVFTYPLSLFTGLKSIQDLDSDATGENNVAGGAFTVYEIVIDNQANPSQKVYTKLYDNVAPTIGTTAPDMILKTGGGKSRSWFFLEGIPFTNLSFATVQQPGTGGVSNPTADVIVTIVGA